jgi:alkylhydroperoxidase family enzyme
MTNQYPAAIQRFVDAVLTTPGETHEELRRTVEARAAQRSGGPNTHASDEVPEELIRYVDKVAKHAYKVTDADVEALRHRGYSEDAIFEITLSAALGAGLARMERGLEALR